MAVALRMLLTGLIAAFFLPGFWSLASAWIFRADLREVSNFTPVGVIEFSLPEGRSTGTAFLIGECAVMTNFHVVFGPWELTALRPPSSANKGTFTLTQATSTNGEHPSTGAIPVIWGDYTGPDRQFRKPANDWVVLALEDCLGDRHGYLLPYDAALNEDIPNRGGFTAVGYSAGRQKVDPNCSIRLAGDSGSGATMLNDCATLPGDSGCSHCQTWDGQGCRDGVSFSCWLRFHQLQLIQRSRSRKLECAMHQCCGPPFGTPHRPN